MASYPVTTLGADKAGEGEVLATLSEDDPLHSGVEFSDPEAGIPEEVRREGGKEGKDGEDAVVTDISYKSYRVFP